MATIAVLAICAGQARADLNAIGAAPGTIIGGTPGIIGDTGDPLFDFTYTDVAAGIYASGSVDGIPNGGGTYTAISGNVTFSGSGTVLPGTYNLIANPSAPAEIVSPSGLFLYDNQVLPGQTPPILNGGLLFGTGSLEINLFSNGSGAQGTYSFYEGTAGGYPVADNSGNFTLSAAPEPSSLFIASLGGIAFVAYGWWRRRPAQS
jgi:hypothetical protein